jgi:predicted acyltransferase
MMNQQNFILPSTNRLLSLDILRGMTIAGMIIVNDPGSWSSVYPMLLHADWHGITPTDLVFPFFLFIVGVSITLSYTNQVTTGKPKGKMIGKILKRTLIIFALGMFLWLFPKFSEIRIPGVLQRIALVFMACSMLFIYQNNWKRQTYIGVGLLLAYWVLMTLVPVPIDVTMLGAITDGQVLAHSGMIEVVTPTKISETLAAANLEPGTNLQAWIDRQAIPFRLFQHSWDPEGLLSTLPAIASGITGVLVGMLWLRKDKPEEKVIWMLILGFVWFVLGSFWHWAFPINKNLWTSSYVLYTSGLATMTLAACIWLVDIQGHRKFTFPFVVFGTNAIAAYALHSLLSAPISPVKDLFYNGLVNSGIAPNLASFAWALAYTLICYSIIWILYKRRIFIKI